MLLLPNMVGFQLCILLRPPTFRMPSRPVRNSYPHFFPPLTQTDSSKRTLGVATVPEKGNRPTQSGEHFSKHRNVWSGPLIARDKPIAYLWLSCVTVRVLYIVKSNGSKVIKERQSLNSVAVLLLSLRRRDG